MSTARKPRLVHGTQRTIARTIGVRPATLSKVFAGRQALGIERAALCSAIWELQGEPMTSIVELTQKPFPVGTRLFPWHPAQDRQTVEAVGAARDAWLLRELACLPREVEARARLIGDPDICVVAVARLRAGAEPDIVLGTGPGSMTAG